MAIPKIAFKVNVTQYAKVANLGGTVASAMTSNPNFSTPAVSIPDLILAVNAVLAAITAWGTKTNRGSHAALLDLKAKTIDLMALLRDQARYVETTASQAAGQDMALMASIIGTSGFGLKAQKHPQGMLEQVQKLRVVFSAQLNRNQAKLEWEKPLNVTTPKNVGTYEVYQSLTPDFSTATLIGNPTKTEWIISNNGSSVVTIYVWVRAVGAGGQGVISNMIVITLLAAA